MADSGRPTGPRDSRSIAPADPGRTTEPRPSQRITAPTQRLSASGPIHLPAAATGTTHRKTLLVVAGVVVLLIVALVFVLSSDADDSESRTNDTGSAMVEPHAESAAGSNPAAAPAQNPVLRRGTVATQPAPPGPRRAAIPTGAVDAGVAVQADVALARARDAGAAPVAQPRRALLAVTPAVKAGAAPPKSVDAGVAASKDGGLAQPALAVATPAIPRRDGAGRLDADADDGGGGVRVARFVATGGVDLEGRVVNLDTGRPVSGTSVEARFGGRSVEVETDATGAFKMPGMVPGSKVLVWIGGRRDRMVAERLDVGIPDNGKKADLGVVALLDGDELASRLDGWVGLYLARQGGQIRVSAVNAWVPAQRAGIQVGDALLTVDGRDVRRLGMRTVGFLMRGPTGSSVTLEIESNDGKKRKLTLERVSR